jgi:hypothetical protein
VGTEGTDNSKLIGSYDSNSVTHVHLPLLHYLRRVILGQTRPGRPGPQKSSLLSVPDLSPKRPGLLESVPDGSFPLIVLIRVG